MMNKELIVDLLNKSKEILDNMVFGSKNDAEFPCLVDKKDIAELKSLVLKAELLLLNEPTAITETALAQTLMLGDSAAEVENSTIEEAAAVSSETRGVRQNEQTKELCLSCHSKAVAVKGELWCNACFLKKLKAQ